MEKSFADMINLIYIIFLIKYQWPSVNFGGNRSKEKLKVLSFGSSPIMYNFWEMTCWSLISEGKYHRGWAGLCSPDWGDGHKQDFTGLWVKYRIAPSALVMGDVHRSPQDARKAEIPGTPSLTSSSSQKSQGHNRKQLQILVNLGKSW